jgi:chromosome segregation ATPase
MLKELRIADEVNRKRCEDAERRAAMLEADARELDRQANAIQRAAAREATEQRRLIAQLTAAVGDGTQSFTSLVEERDALLAAVREAEERLERTKNESRKLLEERKWELQRAVALAGDLAQALEENGAKVIQLTEQIEVMTREIAELQRENEARATRDAQIIEQLRNREAQLESKIEQLKEQIRTQRKNAEYQCTALHEEMTMLRQELERADILAREQASQHRMEVAHIESLREDFERQSRLAELKNQELQLECQDAVNALTTVRGNLGAVQAQSNKRLDMIASQQQELEQLRKELEAQRRAAKKEKDEVNGQFALLQQQLAESRGIATQALAEKDEADKRLSMEQTLNEALQQERGQLQKELGDARTQRDALQQGLAQAQMERDERQRKADQLQRNVAALQRELAQAQEENKQLQQKLKAQEEARRKAVEALGGL